MAVDLDFERTLHRRDISLEDNLFTTLADRVLRRVEEVIDGRNCKWPPHEDQKRLLRALRSHQGKKRAVPLAHLIARLSLSGRQLKDMVQDLRLNFGVQLGASRDSEAGGYYLVEVEAESVESTEQMFHQAITMLRVVAAMRGRDQMEQMFGQLRLELAKEDTRG